MDFIFDTHNLSNSCRWSMSSEPYLSSINNSETSAKIILASAA